MLFFSFLFSFSLLRERRGGWTDSITMICVPFCVVETGVARSRLRSLFWIHVCIHYTHIKTVVHGKTYIASIQNSTRSRDRATLHTCDLYTHYYNSNLFNFCYFNSLVFDEGSSSEEKEEPPTKIEKNCSSKYLSCFSFISFVKFLIY